MDDKKTLQLRGISEPSSSRSSEEKGDSSSLKLMRDLEDLESLQKEQERRKDDIKEREKNLERRSSFDTNYRLIYWLESRDIVKEKMCNLGLTRRISIASMKDMTRADAEEAFEESEECRRINDLEESYSLTMKRCEEQAAKRPNNSEGFGLLKSSRGKPDRSLRASFRKALILAYGSLNADPHREVMWCPATRLWYQSNSIVAGHLFPCRSGEVAMRTVFGCSEMFEPVNGIFWAKGIERRFEAGHLTIVPDIADGASKEQAEIWEASNPKEYKIRVLNPEAKEMQMFIDITDQRYADLDNQRLQFKTDFRPRASYLYYTYCAVMLRRSFGSPHHPVDSPKADPGKNLWGVPGKYMRASMLLGFVEEMGREYEYLLEGAIEEDGAVADPTALEAANAQIQWILESGSEEDGDSEDESEEEEGSEEEESEEEESEYEDEEEYEDKEEAYFSKEDSDCEEEEDEEEDNYREYQNSEDEDEEAKKEEEEEEEWEAVQREWEKLDDTYTDNESDDEDDDGERSAVTASTTLPTCMQM